MQNSDFYIRNKFLKYGVYEHMCKYSYDSNKYEVQGQNESEIYELEVFKCYN